MKRLHELSPEEIEEWREARAEAGREKYGVDHLNRYNLVDVMEELLDALNILSLLEEQLIGENTHYIVLTQMMEFRQIIYENIDKLQEMDKHLQEKFCEDRKADERVWWDD